MIQFSIVVPICNEIGHIESLLHTLTRLTTEHHDHEIIFVDAGSHDGTLAVIQGWPDQAHIRVIEHPAHTDRMASIQTGIANAQSHVIVLMMDSNSNLTPESMRKFVDPILEGTCDLTIGSNSIPDSPAPSESGHHSPLSRLIAWLAQSICDTQDPTSGLFAFRRELFKAIPDQTREDQLLPELTLTQPGQLKIIEVPVSPANPAHDQSNASFSRNWALLRRLTAFAGGAISFDYLRRHIVIGLLTAMIDAGLFLLLLNSGIGLIAASMSSFLIATLLNDQLKTRWSWLPDRSDLHQRPQRIRFWIAGSLVLLLRGGMLALFVQHWALPPAQAILAAIIAMTALISFPGAVFYVSPTRAHPEIRWRIAAIGVIAYVVLLRWVFLGQTQLIPDEAYYWAYTQHMDLSFYDHPPMVAWLIAMGNAIGGDGELGVRIGAFLSGLIAMGYLSALAGNLYDRATALRTALLLSILPFSFVMGFLMTTDAPLIAAWAATLYYMERALLSSQRTAWFGMGVAFGLGILSKYTLGILGLAALVFVVIDPVSRRWLLKPHPYLAATLALVLFSPVIIWNMQHDWASIMFQSSRAAGIGTETAEETFSTHLLLRDFIILLSPTGLLAAFMALLPAGQRIHSNPARRRQWFVWIFTGVPLFTFVVFSMLDALRFHWTAPAWLALLPTMAWMMRQDCQLPAFIQKIQVAWKHTITVLLLSYALALHYVTLGIPGMPYPTVMQHYFWKETTAEIENIVDEVRRQTKQEPLVVGMSKWSVASAVAFYNHPVEIPLEIRSRNLFDDSAAMYEFWYPSTAPIQRPIVLVGMKPKHLEQDRKGQDIARMLDQPGPIQQKVILREGKPLRFIYYRIAQGYLGSPSQKENNSLDETSKQSGNPTQPQAVMQ